MAHIQIGDVVLVHIPTFDKSNEMLRKFQGNELVVAKKVPIRGYRAAISDSLFYYELYGAESEMGVRYAFLPDWIIKL